MTDGTRLESEVKDAVADFETHDLLGLINGIKVVGKMIHEVNGDLQDCKDMKSDIARIENWALIFENPKELV